mgnify:CR=1 FL=1
MAFVLCDLNIGGTQLGGRFLLGADFSLIPPNKWLDAFARAEFKEEYTSRS